MKTKTKREVILRLRTTTFMPIFILVALYACQGKDGQTVLMPDKTAPTTMADPSGGIYSEVQFVTLTTDETATVFYSIDGVDPAQEASNTISGSSPVFWVRIGAGTTVLKFFAVDSEGNQEPVKTETYNITLASPPPPVANAGPDRPAIIGSQVTLDGSGSSTATGTPLSYRWSLTSTPGGSAAALTNPAFVNPSFIADLDGSYTASLVVNDGRMDSIADTVVITAHPYRFPDTGQTVSYTTTFGEDADYTINPPSYADNGDGTIVDNNTALVWQKQDDGTIRLWEAANVYCAGLSLAGSGWRLPTYLELMTIVDFGRFSPAIDTAHFPSTHSSSYWSVSNFALSSDTGWGADFFYGAVNPLWKMAAAYVRCVRGEERSSVFTDNNDGTVTDTVTGLMWQKSDDGLTRTWEQSLSYCEGLSLAGFTDWRLPNAKELNSIVDTSRYYPSTDTVFNTQLYSSYWTSTSDAHLGTTSAWQVGFNAGGLQSYDKTSSFYVYARCVR